MIKIPFLFFLSVLVSAAIFFIPLKKGYTSTALTRTVPFPISKPFHEGYLKVSSIHELWYAEYGNPMGVPVIVLHGGPGGGCNDDDMKFFDMPGKNLMILYLKMNTKIWRVLTISAS